MCRVGDLSLVEGYGMKVGDGDLYCVVCGESLYGNRSAYKNHHCDEKALKRIESSRKSHGSYRGNRAPSEYERLAMGEFLQSLNGDE